MGVQNFMGQMAYIVAPWFLLIMQASMFTDMVEGASYLAIAIGVLAIGVGILPAIFLKERFSHPEPTEEELAAKAQKVSLWEIVKKNMLEFFIVRIG